ncbi:BatD family protein [Luteimonas sp. A482]
MSLHIARALACALVLSFAGGLTTAHAATRAWLDRDRIEVGETTTLNIETDQADARMPDFSALVPDFVLSAHSSSRGSDRVNGQLRERVLFAVALKPRREGLMTVPALRVGNESTGPLQLTVTPASTAPARAGEPVFIEGEADSQSPYVQQSIGYTLRLYYATPLVSGQLDQPEPDGASIQRIGSDLQYTRELDGRRYTVVERRFLIVPERSGTLTIPGARFEGTGVGGYFDDMFGSGRRALQANGPPRILDVRPLPDGAPQPWLPLHGLELRYVATPQQARAGEAATIDVELVADGAAASQLPELVLPPVEGAQVFPEPAQVDESFERGRLRTKVTRRFSLVPAAEGRLHVAAPRVTWWDVRAGVARTASLPALELEVAAGSAAPAAASVEYAAGPASVRGTNAWPWIALGFALLWLATLAWALRRRARADEAAIPQQQPSPPGPTTSPRALQRVLSAGDPSEVEHALCALASPPAASLETLSQQIADPRQRDALLRLQQARWADGDITSAREALREAFAQGPVWSGDATPVGPAPELLPPLYPGPRGH